MAIAHVALWATDLDRVCAFYEALGATRGPRYDNPAKGFSSHFLSWPGSGVRLEVMHRAGLERPAAGAAGWAHVALALGSEDAVDRAATALADRLVDGPRRTGDGYYECVVLDPEGNRVELTV
jgi:lactoylglutathione lyase